jgi:hypothetical protein
MTPEGKIKSKARAEIHRLGFYTFPVNQRGIGRRGIPDDFMLMLGVPFFIEFKAHMRWDTNKKVALATLPTLLQTSEMQDIRAANGNTLVIDDIGLPVFIDWLHRCRQDSSVHLCPELSWNISKTSMVEYMNASESDAKSMLMFETKDGRSCVVPFIRSIK